MAELNLGIFLGGLLHKGLVAEGIGEDDLAALVLGQVNGGIVAGAVLADIGDDDDLIIGEAEVRQPAQQPYRSTPGLRERW
mgnify:CR=1 FL=1